MAICSILQGIYEIINDDEEIEIFLESTFEILSDIDFILQDYRELKSLILGKSEERNIKEAIMRGNSVFLSELSSGHFKTDILRKAHKLNPIKIRIGVLKDYPKYSALKNEIHLGFSSNPLHWLIKGNYNPDYALSLLQDDLHFQGKKVDRSELEDSYDTFMSFFSEREMKAITIHEVSHWLRETFSGGNLFKKRSDEIRSAEDKTFALKSFLQVLSREAKVDPNKIDRMNSQIKKLNKIIKDGLKYGAEDISLTHYEIDAQIHELVFLHKEISLRDWDDLTFPKMFSYLEGLRSIDFKLKNDKRKYKDWCHLIFKRLLREGILPKRIAKEYREAACGIRRDRRIKDQRVSNKFQDVIY